MNFLKELTSQEHNIHYVKKYISYCNSIKQKDRQIKGEIHHILPKSIFPEYSNLNKHKENSILFTYREHIIAHYMLAKALGGNMWYAVNLMNNYNKTLKSTLYTKVKNEYNKNIIKSKRYIEYSENNKEIIKNILCNSYNDNIALDIPERVTKDDYIVIKCNIHGFKKKQMKDLSDVTYLCSSCARKNITRKSGLSYVKLYIQGLVTKCYDFSYINKINSNTHTNHIKYSIIRKSFYNNSKVMSFDLVRSLKYRTYAESSIKVDYNIAKTRLQIESKGITIINNSLFKEGMSLTELSLIDVYAEMSCGHNMYISKNKLRQKKNTLCNICAYKERTQKILREKK